jgi:signal peptidase I
MRKMFRFLFWVALVTTALVGVARATAIRWWRVPQADRYLTASISPSLRGGDLVLLWRLTPPTLGDLVLCPEPNHPERVVVGRIAAHGRDHVEVVGANVSRNGHRYTVDSNCAQRVFTESDPETAVQLEQSCSIENVNGVTSLRGELNSAAPPPKDVPDTQVPRDALWLVSDNRQYPYDSRDFGPVPLDSCHEKVFFRLVSAAGFGDADHRNQLVR